MRWRPCSTSHGWEPWGSGAPVDRGCATGITTTPGCEPGAPDSSTADPRAGQAYRGGCAGVSPAPAARTGDAGASAAADRADPGAATGFGVGVGAGALCAGVQPARTLRPGRARPRRVGPQRPCAAATGGVLGA